METQAEIEEFAKLFLVLTDKERTKLTNKLYRAWRWCMVYNHTGSGTTKDVGTAYRAVSESEYL